MRADSHAYHAGQRLLREQPDVRRHPSRAAPSVFAIMSYAKRLRLTIRAIFFVPPLCVFFADVAEIVRRCRAHSSREKLCAMPRATVPVRVTARRLLSMPEKYR